MPSFILSSTLAYTTSLLNRPHILSGVTQKDGAPVSRRVVVVRRSTLELIAATVTGTDGLFNFIQLPPQTLDQPYTAIRYDDSVVDPDNAEVFDYVYQVDSLGNPPVE